MKVVIAGERRCYDPASPVRFPNMGKSFTPDAGYVVDLLKREGLYTLGGGDGCACAHFCIDNIHVDVACHKSSAGGDGGPAVVVYSRYLDWDDSYGQPVADEVVSQLRKTYYPESEIKVSLKERRP